MRKRLMIYYQIGKDAYSFFWVNDVAIIKFCYIYNVLAPTIVNTKYFLLTTLKRGKYGSLIAQYIISTKVEELSHYKKSGV